MGRVKQYDDKLRRRLVDEAGRLLTAEGIGAVTLRRVASLADTSTTAVYSLFGDKDGSHATASEVSVTQYAYPEYIKKAQMEWTGKAKRGFYDAEDYRRTFPDGRIGSDPSLASPEAGRKLTEASVADVIDDYKKFMAQE